MDLTDYEIFRAKVRDFWQEWYKICFEGVWVHFTFSSIFLIKGVLQSTPEISNIDISKYLLNSKKGTLRNQCFKFKEIAESLA